MVLTFFLGSRVRLLCQPLRLVTSASLKLHFQLESPACYGKIKNTVTLPGKLLVKSICDSTEAER